MKKMCVGMMCVAVLGSGCAVVNQDQVGVRRTFGALEEEILQPGLHGVNPFTTTMITLPVRTSNMEVRLDLPSKEGLSVRADISILYRIDPTAAKKILTEVGENQERVYILSVFRSASADVCARFMAKDMHSGERALIEEKIRERMMELLGDRGFVIESVLMKSIALPGGLARAIEMRLEAEQDALRMKYVLESEQQEAERKRIEATGTRDAQKILSEGLTPQILKLRAIEAFRDLALSPNAKVIVTDGDGPLLTESVDVSEGVDAPAE
jgi:regulator of protease activity HflC (stomatin/prohibitin superfamily)